MAVPQRRTGKTRKRIRRGNIGLTEANVIPCPHCGAMIKSHVVCPKCGYYNGKKVKEVKTQD